MTFNDLVKLPRIGKGSLLGLWIKASEDGDTKMVDLTMSALARQNELSGLGSRDDRGVPMVGNVTPGHSRELLRRIDLREKG